MTHSSSSRSNSSSMDHEPTITSNVKDERLILPPISSMDGFFTSRSWPPPSTTIHTTLNSSSTSSYMDITSPSISRNNNEPWSPIPNKQNDDHSHRSDYFTTTATTTAAATSTNSSYSSLSLSPMDRDDIRYKGPYNNSYESHYRQKSLPQISTFRKNSINSIISQQPTAAPTINQQPVFRYQPNSTLSSPLTKNPTHVMNNYGQPDINIDTSNNTQPFEFVLTPSSLSTPSLRSIEKDIEEVIKHCNSLADNMNQKKNSIVENDNYFSNPTSMRPWLDDMIGRANEVLNALLRLRKHQLAAEYARLHRISDQQQYRHGAEDNEIWDASNNLMTSTGGVMSVNSVRLRKRGKRPVFQNRCHSCHISETPEWRRGPDGARTLCNACGLHYAKLAKKKIKQDDVKKELLEEDRDDTSMK